LANAEFFAQKAIYKAKTRNQWSLSICGNMCLARLAVLNGKPREACAILETLQAEKEVTGRPILQNGADIAAGYIYGCLGKLGKIPQWLREGDLSRCNLFYQGMGINYIIIGKAAILRKNYAQLEVIVETMWEIYKPNNHVFGLIYTGIYEAIAKNRLHGPERAGEALLYAVKLAMADGIITPFAENMPELDPVFQWIRWDGDGEWTDKVLHLGGRFMKAVEKMDKENDIQPLTEREKDVINLLEEGCKQKEIAERLCLSPNTVRRHLQNAYGKLGVNNVTQAIKKVRELTS
jgi:LuxR family maltose regulon positive regulatory protein